MPSAVWELAKLCRDHHGAGAEPAAGQGTMAAHWTAWHKLMQGRGAVQSCPGVQATIDLICFLEKWSSEAMRERGREARVCELKERWRRQTANRHPQGLNPEHMYYSCTCTTQSSSLFPSPQQMTEVPHHRRVHTHLDVLSRCLHAYTSALHFGGC